MTISNELGWFFEEQLVSTRRFDQYALIVFWRKLDSDAACCLSTVEADQLGVARRMEVEAGPYRICTMQIFE